MVVKVKLSIHFACRRHDVETSLESHLVEFPLFLVEVERPRAMKVVAAGVHQALIVAAAAVNLDSLVFVSNVVVWFSWSTYLLTRSTI